MSHNATQITFLDVENFKDCYNVLLCKLFRKSTAGNTILYSTSFHPRPFVYSIPYSQYLRIKRNCSKEADFKHEAKNLKQRLLDKGYTGSHKCLKKAFKRVVNKNRHDLLFPSKKEMYTSQDLFVPPTPLVGSTDYIKTPEEVTSIKSSSNRSLGGLGGFQI